MARVSLADEPVSYLAPARLNVFADRPARGRRYRRYCELTVQRIGWQGWNPDPMMEDRMARLPGSGSFYWANALRAYWAAKRMLRQDATIRQIAIETISGREIARIYR